VRVEFSNNFESYQCWQAWRQTVKELHTTEFMAMSFTLTPNILQL